MASSLNTSLPVYVTRKSADGETGTWSISAWMPIYSMLLLFLNAIGWGVYGLVELAIHLVSCLPF